MSVRKFRWSKVYESSEEELIELLEAQEISAERIHVDAFEELDATQHEYASTIWCAEGSSTFTARDARSISLQPGDGLNITAQTSYTITGGMTGCAYYIVVDS